MYVQIFLHEYIHSTDLNLEWFEDGALRRIICSKGCYPPSHGSKTILFKQNQLVSH